MSWLLVSVGLLWLVLLVFRSVLDDDAVFLTWRDVALALGLCFSGAVVEMGERLRPPVAVTAPAPAAPPGPIFLGTLDGGGQQP